MRSEQTQDINLLLMGTGAKDFLRTYWHLRKQDIGSPINNIEVTPSDRKGTSLSFTDNLSSNRVFLTANPERKKNFNASMVVMDLSQDLNELEGYCKEANYLNTNKTSAPLIIVAYVGENQQMPQDKIKRMQAYADSVGSKFILVDNSNLKAVVQSAIQAPSSVDKIVVSTQSDNDLLASLRTRLMDLTVDYAHKETGIFGTGYLRKHDAEVRQINALVTSPSPSSRADIQKIYDVLTKQLEKYGDIDKLVTKLNKEPNKHHYTRMAAAVLLDLHKQISSNPSYITNPKWGKLEKINQPQAQTAPRFHQ